MRATVKHTNVRNGLYAADIDGMGEFVIFELLDTSEPEIGDILSHPDFYGLGGATFKNLTQQCTIDVFVENIGDPH